MTGRYGLTRRRAVVTVACSGIRRAITAALAAEEATTLAVGRHPGPRAETTLLASDVIHTQTCDIAEADDDVRAAVTASIPIDRMATVADIADVALFTCSNQARRITGQIVAVDGGSTLGTAT